MKMSNRWAGRPNYECSREGCAFATLDKREAERHDARHKRADARAKLRAVPLAERRRLEAAAELETTDGVAGENTPPADGGEDGK